MKRVQPIPGYHHISIVTFPLEALSRSRRDNIETFVTWFCQIAEASPHIISYEIDCGDKNSECDENVHFRVVYTDTNALNDVRSLPEHQKMMAWFTQASGKLRLNVDKLVQTQ